MVNCAMNGKLFFCNFDNIYGAIKRKKISSRQYPKWSEQIVNLFFVSPDLRRNCCLPLFYVRESLTNFVDVLSKNIHNNLMKKKNPKKNLTEDFLKKET